jgi:hypothetical protein
VLIDPVYLAIAGAVALGLAMMIPSWVGDLRWYKGQRRRMESDRPPLSDAAFLGSVPIGEGEGALWLAVRRAVADSIGLPCEAIYPEDRLADLWRMQSLGPDLMDIIFRMERLLGFRISRRSLDLSFRSRYGREGEFREFAASAVRAIGRANLVPPQGR